jgi:hypothetical protein
MLDFLGECCQSIASMRLLIRPRLECTWSDHCVRCLLLSLLEVVIDRHSSRSMWKSDSLSFQIVFWSVSIVVVSPSLLHTLCVRHPTLELLSILINLLSITTWLLLHLYLSILWWFVVSTLWSDTVCIIYDDSATVLLVLSLLLLLSFTVVFGVTAGDN